MGSFADPGAEWKDSDCKLRTRWKHKQREKTVFKIKPSMPFKLISQPLQIIIRLRTLFEFETVLIESEALLFE